MTIPTHIARRRLALAALLLSVLGASLLAQDAGWWTAPPAPATATPSLTPLLGSDADFAWTASHPTYTLSDEAGLGPVLTNSSPKVLVLEGATRLVGDYEWSALLRLPTREALARGAFSISLARKDPKDPKDTGLRVNLTTSNTAESVSLTTTFLGKQFSTYLPEASKQDWAPTPANSFTYNLRAYAAVLPGWEEDFRAQVAHAMGRLPDHNQKWLRLRVSVAKGQAQIWLDEHLAATLSTAELLPEGTLRLELGVQAQLAQVRLSRPPATPGFLPIRLDGALNGRELLPGVSVAPASLPPPDQVVQVAGVPFRFPGVNQEGHDHLDLSQSHMRQANAEGYLPSNIIRWLGVAARDPGRIQVRVASGQYDSLYLIATSDGRADSVPLVTASFYRPGAGFSESFSGTVPEWQATAEGVQALPVTLSDGRAAKLWLLRIPLDPGRLSSFSDLDILEIELTKEVHLFRSYPDPISYGWHQGGRPSSVHVYALTLGRVPVGFTFTPDQFGHVWTAGQTPAYNLAMTNHGKEPVTATLTVAATSFDGVDTVKVERSFTVPPGRTLPYKWPLAVKQNGYYDVAATMTVGDRRWTEKRSLVKLAPDTRSAKHTPGRGALFGYWSYHGGHYTPKAEHHIRLMTLAGARVSIASGSRGELSEAVATLQDKHWSNTQAGAWEVSPQAWSAKEPLDPEQVSKYQAAIIEKIKLWREKLPEDKRPDHVYFYPEPHISSRLSAGNVPEYWNEKPFELTPDEQTRLKMFFNTSKMAAEAIRRDLPGLKVLIPWGDPGFVWPLLRAGFPRELIDGTGIDIPGFERIPERQLHEQSLHRLYTLRQEFKKFGMDDPQLQFCEGIFVPTEPGAVTWREQMDIYHRTTLLSLAYGVTRFYSSWFAFDAGSYYGAEHYGGCGIQRRIPYCDPKPAYAAYATMTDKLNEANFDGWVPTGSLSTYALRFKHPERGLVYAVWTLRGHRPVTVTLPADGKVALTDSMNNTKTLTSKDRQVTFPSDASVRYLVLPNGQALTGITLGVPDHAEAQPPPTAVKIGSLGDGQWQFTDERDATYESNHWAVMKYHGRFGAKVVPDAQQGPVLSTTLEKQDREVPLMPWYRVLAPAKPIVLPGAPSHLGLWAKGNSDWGRVIYILRDAKGERWLSIGEKDQYNCDDVHSWSMFNFDGWRYLSFELPGHLGYDKFRLAGTTWWRSEGGDRVVDLPLSLDRIIVEQRSHILYVNDPQPVAGNEVKLGGLFLHYTQPGDASEEAVRQSRLRTAPPAGLPELPNPIAELARDGVGAPTKITQILPPEHQYDGTRAHVHYEEVPGAKTYQIWVSAYADGRGAVNMTPKGATNGILIRGLRPAIKLYYWVTWQDEAGKTSKPSPVREEVLIDAFKEK